MEQRPVYLQGRGRGRGRGRSGAAPPGGGFENQAWQGPGRGRGNVQNKENVPMPSQNRWKKDQRSTGPRGMGQEFPQEQRRANTDAKAEKMVTAQKRFEKAQAEQQKAVQRHLEGNDNGFDSSDDDEDLNDVGILDTMVKSFSNKFDGTGEAGELGRTHEFVANSMRSNVCLICIESIKRNEAIWSCRGCYTMFHIPCIQKWVKEGVYKQTAFTDEDVSTKDVPWYCPKCRHEYRQGQCPTRYYCFCGKVQDPSFDPWLVPHSCGQTCERGLIPQCGHQCLLLCHPGPCPPCPQTVTVTCYCKKQPAQTRRCGTREWSCGKPCGKLLSCGHHRCKNLCHAGECASCLETSQQKCLCGRKKQVRPCASPQWQCEKVCGRALRCGNHTCEKTCHAGGCGDCPRAGKRSCPCGKTVVELPCTEDVATCPDTCGKPLDCGMHSCSQRCHTGTCGTCREMTVKTCRCGQKKKEIQCFKEYLCEIKCSRMRDCGRHPCRRKCCDGTCPPCDQQCGKTLGCRNHKCSSRCHRGPCYPCPLTVTVSCNCGASSITVPCGREKVTKPPRCNQKCKNPPDCHHEERIPHRCHFGRCPPCALRCGKPLPQCEHTCPVTCHSAVLTKIQEKVRRAGPWEPAPRSYLETLDKPCPPCLVPIPVTCLGKHCTENLSCFMARVRSCERPCGRTLSCTNHTCQLSCHLVEGAKDDLSAGSTCQKCEEPCEKARPEGCSHRCLLPCHPGDCPPCKQRIRMRCHCQLVVQHIECGEWTDATPEEKDELKACTSRCPRNLQCGHQCTVTCHAGQCPTTEQCQERVKVRCACRRRKRDFPCYQVQAGQAMVDCDEVCLENQQKQKQLEEEIQRVRKAEEEKKQQEELEQFERKRQGRKRKNRNRYKEEENKPTFSQKYAKFVIIPILIILLAIFAKYLLEI